MDNQETEKSLYGKIQEMLPQVVAKGEIKKLKQGIEILEGRKPHLVRGSLGIRKKKKKKV